jgi:hypothetical protein
LWRVRVCWSVAEVVVLSTSWGRIHLRRLGNRHRWIHVGLVLRDAWRSHAVPWIAWIALVVGAVQSVFKHSIIITDDCRQLGMQV